MNWSGVMGLLMLSATVTFSSKLVAENTILDDIKDKNDSSIVIIVVNNTTPDKSKEESNIKFSTSSNTYETKSETINDNTLSNLDKDTTVISHQTTENTKTPTSRVSTTEELSRSNEIIIMNDNNADSSSRSKSFDIQPGGVIEEVYLPEQNVEHIDGVDVENLIQTTHGTVKGFQWRGIPGVIAYVDIPYGKFEGYFKPPVSPSSWTLIHQVTEHKKRCPQIVDDDYVGDLDCLTLSVFAPLNSVNASVMFHVHESHFASGSGDPAKYGPEYLVSRGIILVLPNYRLGPLGFLCLRNETAPGNAALKDLTFALEWTKSNIYNFGGNPQDITLSGDGSAGALVGYLALSSKSNYYINKAITESGAVLSHWAIDRSPDITADTLAEKIRSKDHAYSNTFAEADIELIVKTAKDVDLRPCIESGDDAFIVNTPWEILYQTYNNITFMMGSPNLAGAREAHFKTEDSIAHMNEDFSEFLPNDLHFKSHEERSQIGERIKAFYYEESNISVENVRKLALYFTDASYLVPGIRTARSLVKAGSTVYLYEFSFVGLLNRELIAIDKTLDGAVKGDLVGYLFTQDGYIPAADTEERRIVNLVADLWANFIKTGKPTAEDVEWDPIALSEDLDEVYLSINSHCEQKNGLHVNRIRFWTEIYDEHFIEHNHAFTHKASVVTSIGILMLWLGLWKNVTRL